MEKILKINPRDNVAVALQDLPAGSSVQADGQTIFVKTKVAAGHKLALQPIARGDCIVKYGYPIGIAACSIAQGDWVHTHNVQTRLGDLLEYAYAPDFEQPKPEPPKTFLGYRRKNGKVGIRNEVWIIPTVGCVNAVAKQIEKESQKFLTPTLDGIYCYNHPYGCSQLSQDKLNTESVLAGLVNHPNAGAVLVLGLGCENSNVEELKKALGTYDPDRVKFLVCQEHESEVEDAVQVMQKLCTYAAQFRREPCSADQLVVGLKCGGSDGFSGITANPLLGEFSDYIVDNGGITILTEVPEMFGAETILMERAESEEVFEDIVELINNFKEYFLAHNLPIYENPSPGNKEGGISTLEDKSLGCTQKGGKSKVVDVLKYGEISRNKGLNLLNSPGNDLVASTALGASGCHMVLFTTGRGTPFGSFVPTVKVSTNSKLYQLKLHWIDFNAGVLLEDKLMEEVLTDFIDYVISVASGEYVNNEKNGFKEISILKTGVTL